MQLVAILTSHLSIFWIRYSKREITYWEIVDKIAKYPSPKLEGEGFSDLFKDFITQCLDKNMETRPSTEKLLVRSQSNVLESWIFEEVCRGGCKAKCEGVAKVS